MKVVWSPLALDRVVEIATHIAGDNPDAAEQWIQKLFAKTGQLANFPESGHRIAETPRRDIRELTGGNYRIIYRIESGRVSILTVRHMRQILPGGDLK
jgi:toxin ParE1/3/4